MAGGLARQRATSAHTVANFKRMSVPWHSGRKARRTNAASAMKNTGRFRVQGALFIRSC